MAVKLSPLFMDCQLINAIPANGAKLFTYAAGSTTKQTTYTDSAGTVANPNPIVLNSRGEPPNSIWLTSGQTYKFVFTNSTDTDPPTSPIRTIDNISGVNDTSSTIDQWVASNSTPIYVSGTSFTVAGDKTSDFQVNRRMKLSITAGVVYGYIQSAVFSTLTTVTVALDSGVLDSGLSSVSLGLLTPNNLSIPTIPDNFPIVSGSSDRTKKLRNEIDGFTTGTTRVATWQDKDITVAGTADITTAINALAATIPTYTVVAANGLTGTGYSNKAANDNSRGVGAIITIFSINTPNGLGYGGTWSTISASTNGNTINSWVRVA